MDEPKVFDIAKPKPSAGTRPVISTPAPTPDPMVKINVSTPDQPPITTQSDSVPVSVNVTTTPASGPEAATSQLPMTSDPIAPSDLSAQPQITDNIPVSQAPTPSPVAEAEVQPAAAPSVIAPSLPGASGTSFDNIPKFGELQPKVDAHPLFSGRKDHRVKVRHTPRFAWPLASLLVLILIGYVAVDAGAVRGYSHLPFHVFKQKQIAETPAITTPVASAASATQNQPQATSDPYANWLQYTSASFGYGFKFPKEYVSFTTQKTTDVNIASAFQSTNPASLVSGAQGPVTLADYKTSTAAITSYKSGPSIALQKDKWVVTAANPADPNKYRIGDSFKDISDVVNNGQTIYTFQSKDGSSLNYNIVFVAKSSLHVITLPSFSTSSSSDQAAYDTLYKQLRDSIELTP